MQFGPFELRTDTGELRKHGIRVKIQAKPLAVLRALLERPGEVVTRDELRDHLWPADTFVDFESGLNTAANRLRLGLGDSADAPRFVETLPRVGYRFIAPVILVGNGAAPASEVSGVGFEMVAKVATVEPASRAPIVVPVAAPVSGLSLLTRTVRTKTAAYVVAGLALALVAARRCVLPLPAARRAHARFPSAHISNRVDRGTHYLSPAGTAGCGSHP